MRTSRTVAVSALLAVVALNFLAACTPKDDSDVFSTPTPIEPEPTPDSHCQIVWTEQNAETPSAIDVFLIDAPAAAWVAGTNTFGEFTGWYQPAIDLAGNAVPATADDTGGVVLDSAHSFTVTLTANELEVGADVEIASLTTAGLLVIGTDGEATADLAGTVDDYFFEGVWSSADAADPLDLGDGLVQITLVDGTNAEVVVLGDYGAFAVCYDAAAAAKPAHGVKHVLKRRVR